MRVPSFARKDSFHALVVFVSTALFLWWLAGRRFVPILDEGIYLDGAARIARGEVPYRDFFVLTGPGIFWLDGVLFRLLGVSLGNAHIPLIVDIAAMAALIYWLTRQLARPAVAWFVTLCFVVFGTADPHIVVVNHRWESGALGFAAIAAVFAIRGKVNPRLSAGAGVAAAAAAWFTPSMGLLVLFLAVWLLFQGDRRRGILPYLGGCAAVSAASLACLAWSGALAPFIQHMQWTAANYSGPNRVPYGAVAGGYWSLLRGSNGVEVAIRAMVVGAIAIPAILPPLNLAGFALSLRRRLGGAHAGFGERRAVMLLMGAMIVLVGSTYPRWDIGHLLYVSPVSFVLLGWLADRTLTPSRQRLAALIPLLLMATFAYNTVQTRGNLLRTQSRGGEITASKVDLELVRAVERHIPAGESLFVFPYMPVIYFFTQATNPTRYCFLQPGMMTDEDERSVIAQLEAAPPKWVIYSDVQPTAFLGIFPSSDPARLRMPLIEAFIRGRYSKVDAHRHWSATYQILRLREDAVAAQPRPSALPSSSRPLS